MTTYRSLSQLQERNVLPVVTADLEEVENRYAIGITEHLAELAERDGLGPIARQFIPHTDELNQQSNELADPIGDNAHSPVPGIVHRYPDRVLLKAVAVCPVYCRFCFRREMVGPGKDKNLNHDELNAAIDYIRSDPNIWEVILTGGDPFMLSEARVRTLTAQLADIPHLRIIRWHTRMPVADPARVTKSYADALRSTRLTPIVAVHTNHIHELTTTAAAAIATLADAGIPVRSQSVMLAGVNDDVDALVALMRRLVELRVQPYYIHQLDYAPGTSHFRVPLDRAQEIMRELRDRVSGLCQPQFVIDIPGGVSKALASPSDVSADRTTLRGRDGVWRPYGEG